MLWLMLTHQSLIAGCFVCGARRLVVVSGPCLEAPRLEAEVDNLVGKLVV
jgi:hypothetical protein